MTLKDVVIRLCWRVQYLETKLEEIQDCLVSDDSLYDKVMLVDNILSCDETYSEDK